MAVERVTLKTSDGLALEGELKVPDDATSAAVLAHPHPQFGGNMVVRLSPGSTGVAVGLGAVIGGTTGNLLDRLRRGWVVDFVSAGAWPVFNVADAAMVVGFVVALGAAV